MNFEYVPSINNTIYRDTHLLTVLVSLFIFFVKPDPWIHVFVILLWPFLSPISLIENICYDPKITAWYVEIVLINIAQKA